MTAGGGRTWYEKSRDDLDGEEGGCDMAGGERMLHGMNLG